MPNTSQLQQYITHIDRLPVNTPLTKAQLLTPEFLLSKHGDLDVYYAPHNEFIQPEAQIIIIGITPGWTQMELAFRQVRRDLEEGIPIGEMSRRAKQTARFAGTMRSNLIGMLDLIGLHEVLGIPSCSALFASHEHLVHTTSLLPYPVFYKGRNYTGHQPRLVKSPFLLNAAVEASPLYTQAASKPLILPLGKTVEETLSYLIAAGTIPEVCYLTGLPHPSGANGHRRKQLEANLPDLRKQVMESWKNR